MSADQIILNQSVRDFDASPEYDKITGVKIITGKTDDNQEVYEFYGNEEGYVLTFENPWGTRKMAKNILSKIKKYAYQPFTASDAILDPVAEIGDAVTVGGINSVIAELETKFTPLMPATISAPNGSDIDHEYTYDSVEKRSVKSLSNSINTLRTSFNVTNGQIESRIESVEDTVKGNKEKSIVGLVTQVSDVTQTVEGLTILTTKDVIDIVTTDEEGNISNKLLDPKFAQYLGTDDDGKIYTLSSWAEVNITSDYIESKVSEKFVKSEDAQGAYDGIMEYIDGTYKTNLTNTITASYESAITQKSDEIKLTVASAVSKYDTSHAALVEVTGDQSVSLSLYGYGKPVNKYSKNPTTAETRVKASEHTGEYYLSQSSGYIYRSDGTKWTKFSKKLKTIEDRLSSRIEIAEDNISSIVSAEYATGESVETMIKQTLKDITLSVTSSEEGSTYISLTSGDVTVKSQEINMYVDAANIHGTLSADKIESQSLTANDIAASSITGDKIASSTITADNIAASAITTDKIATGSITADKIKAGEVLATSVAAYSTITAPTIVGGTFTDTTQAVNFNIYTVAGNPVAGYMNFAPHGLEGTWYNYFSVTGQGSGVRPYTSVIIGGMNFFTKNTDDVFVAGGGTFDFSGCTKVKLPGGVEYPPAS